MARHLVHAASLQRRVHHFDLAGRSALSSLDRLNQGFVLVDTGARPLLVNRTAQALLEDGIRVEAGVLSASVADADRLGVTVGTVRCRLSNIFGKTGVRHQAELVRLLLQRGGPGSALDESGDG